MSHRPREGHRLSKTSPKARRRPSKTSPEESTRVTEAFRREEGSHDGITLSWVAALWDPPHRINDQVKGVVTMPTCSLKISKEGCMHDTWLIRAHTKYDGTRDTALKLEPKRPQG